MTDGDDRVRAATVEDLESLVECWVALIEHGRQQGLHIEAGANRTVARETLAAAAADDRAFVAVLRREVVGFCSVSVGATGFDRDVDRGVVENLYVAPPARDDGLGSALLRAGERRLRELGADVLAVETMAADEAARSFYEQRGYAPHRVTVEKRVETNR